jgi:hypothetical protein
MSNNLEGSIKQIDATQILKGDFKKREFVIVTNDKYPQPIKFELIGDSVDYLDSFSVGDNIKVAYTVRGNEYNGKYYVNLKAHAIGLINETQEEAPKKVTKVTQFDDSDDDLPF